MVLLAGDPQSRGQVRSELSDLPAELIELETGSRSADGGDEALEAAVRHALTRVATQDKLARVHHLQERLGQGSSVAIGVADIADAFVRGQVDTLLIDPDAAAQFSVTPERHPGLAFGAVTDVAAEVPADRALVAAAVVTSAEVVVTRTRTLGGAPAAALLRWDQTAVGSHA